MIRTLNLNDMRISTISGWSLDIDMTKDPKYHVYLNGYDKFRIAIYEKSFEDITVIGGI